MEEEQLGIDNEKNNLNNSDPAFEGIHNNTPQINTDHDPEEEQEEQMENPDQLNYNDQRQAKKEQQQLEKKDKNKEKQQKKDDKSYQKLRNDSSGTSGGLPNKDMEQKGNNVTNPSDKNFGKQLKNGGEKKKNPIENKKKGPNKQAPGGKSPVSSIAGKKGPGSLLAGMGARGKNALSGLARGGNPNKTGMGDSEEGPDKLSAGSDVADKVADKVTTGLTNLFALLPLKVKLIIISLFAIFFGFGILVTVILTSTHTVRTITFFEPLIQLMLALDNMEFSVSITATQETEEFTERVANVRGRGFGTSNVNDPTARNFVDIANREYENFNYPEDRGGWKYRSWSSSLTGVDGDWCAMFTSWVANEAGLIDASIVPHSAAVRVKRAWFQERGQFHLMGSGIDPEPGDLMFFHPWSHINIVVDVDLEARTVTTVGGNEGLSSTRPYFLGSRVTRVVRPMNGGGLHGFARPEFGSFQTGGGNSGGSEDLKQIVAFYAVANRYNGNFHLEDMTEDVIRDIISTIEIRDEEERRESTRANFENFLNREVSDHLLDGILEEIDQFIDDFTELFLDDEGRSGGMCFDGDLDTAEGRQQFIGEWLMSTPFDFLNGLPMSQAQAMGFLSNLISETGGSFDPRTIQRNSRTTGLTPETCDNHCVMALGGGGSDGRAFGMIQWDGGRRHSLAAFAESQGKPWYDFEVQIEFLKQELDSPQLMTHLNTFVGRTFGAPGISAGEYAALFGMKFFRSADSNTSRSVGRPVGNLIVRMNDAESLMETFTASNNCFSGEITLPVRAPARVTSEFGWRSLDGSSNFHRGIDFGDGPDAPIYAFRGGVITVSQAGCPPFTASDGCNGGFGNFIRIDHGDGYESIYAHNSTNHVRVGDVVQAGDHIANMGNSGWSRGVHLHFEIIRNGERINPREIIGDLLD